MQINGKNEEGLGSARAGPAHQALRSSRDKHCENNGTARSLDYWKVESCSMHSIEEVTGLNQGWRVTPVYVA